MQLRGETRHCSAFWALGVGTAWHCDALEAVVTYQAMTTFFESWMHHAAIGSHVPGRTKLSDQNAQLCKCTAAHDKGNLMYKTHPLKAQV